MGWTQSALLWLPVADSLNENRMRAQETGETLWGGDFGARDKRDGCKRARGKKWVIWWDGDAWEKQLRALGIS